MITRWLKKYGILKLLIAITGLLSFSSAMITIIIYKFFIVNTLWKGILLSIIIPIIIIPPTFFIIFHALIELEQTKNVLQKLATTDSLTGVHNRAQFIKLAQQTLDETPPDQPVGLAVIDIDRFKLINDHYGHLAGDEALKTIAQTISHNLRPNDVFGRFGGDEFILLTPNTATTEINQIALNLLEQIQGLEIEQDGHQMSLSISIGVTANSPTDTSLHQLIAIADSALLQSKRAGGKSTRYAHHL
ncbi:GGDEF domain-containing protein [bacterium]|nr:GGDEF domain-containing protein [bacterium]MCB2179040.1 GGDEF domain-containing protein [bacterium]